VCAVCGEPVSGVIFPDVGKYREIHEYMRVLAFYELKTSRKDRDLELDFPKTGNREIFQPSRENNSAFREAYGISREPLISTSNG